MTSLPPGEDHPLASISTLSDAPPPGAAATAPDVPGEQVRLMAMEVQDESERRLMASLAISFRDGVYHLGTYRYDRLADAVAYARLQCAQGMS